MTLLFKRKLTKETLMENYREIGEFIDEEFAATPRYLIERAYRFSEGEIEELTPITFSEEENVENEITGETGKIVKILENGSYLVLLDDEETEEIWEADEMVDNRYYDYFPMWGMMWRVQYHSFEDFILENLKEVSRIGFRIYDTEDGDYYLGIEGAGYDFYEAHWIPLILAYADYRTSRI